MLNDLYRRFDNRKLRNRNQESSRKMSTIIIDALKAMKDEGKASFIIGGHNFDSEGHMITADHVFLSWLYKNYIFHA